MKRNEILEYYDFHNDQTDSENVQSVVTPIKIINNEETKNNINEEQERYSDNRNSEWELISANVYKTENSNISQNNKNILSEEKRLSQNLKECTNDSLYDKRSNSENKSGPVDLISDKSPILSYKTPDKVTELQLTSSEEKKENDKDSPYYSGSSNITPYKHLETITEQPTNMEMDYTDWVKSSEPNSSHSNDVKHKKECFKTPSHKDSKFISPHKIKLTDDHKSIVLIESGNKSIGKLSSIIKQSFIRMSPDSRDNCDVEMLKLFTPSPETDKKRNTSGEEPSPVKMYEQIKQFESGTVQRFIWNQSNIEVKNDIIDRKQLKTKGNKLLIFHKNNSHNFKYHKYDFR